MLVERNLEKGRYEAASTRPYPRSGDYDRELLQPVGLLCGPTLGGVVWIVGLENAQVGYIENEEPQPQLPVALGLLNLNPEPVGPSM